MSAQYSHPIRSDVPLIIAYPSTGAHSGYAVLHAGKCKHVHRKPLREPIPFAGDEHYYADDYFVVAPCAKARNKKSATKA